MKKNVSTWAAIGASLLVAACGGGMDSGSAGSQNSNPGRGELMQTPPPATTNLTASDYRLRLISGGTASQGLLALATGSPTGSLTCGVSVYLLKYGTIGGKGEATTSSAAMYVPTGSSACSTSRSIVLHAHGTSPEQRYNLADWTTAADGTTNPAYNESQVLGALYASNGYIVVAPNYAGYYSSTLGYHPYLVASQQSAEMLDALTAAKAALSSLSITPKSNVFVSGYSQGGHVALATYTAMKTDSTMIARLAALGLNAVATAPMSGPYAAANFGDTIMAGAVNAGSTSLLPMLLTGYQKTYGNIYTSTSDVYESTYANGIESYFPGSLSYANLISSGKIPQYALFSATSTPAAPSGSLNALWQLGFGSPNLIKDSFRSAYLADYVANGTSPTNGLRINARKNDLTLTAPQPVGPTLLCGGGGDPTVYYSVNTTALKTVWTANAPTTTAAAVTELNMDTTPGIGNGTLSSSAGFAALQSRFTSTYSGSATNYQTNLSGYHGGLVPYCVAAARGYFDALNQ